MSGVLRVELGELASNSRVWLNGDEITDQLVGVSIDAHAPDATRAILEFAPVRVVGTVTAPIPGFDGIERLRRRFGQ